MREKQQRAVAIVGVGAILPDATDAGQFWDNIKGGRYSISEVPEGRWDPELYYDPDPKAPGKTYSKIGGWVTEWAWEPLKWRLPIPPRVSESLDRAQKWAIVAAREALADYGYPDRSIDRERTAVILGNAMAGDNHLLSAMSIFVPEFSAELESAPSFAALPETVRAKIASELSGGVARRFPEITEDTMPGELGNIIAGRVAALFDLNGPNFVCDAACASAMAAFDAAVEGLEEHEYDAVICGGVDANMSASTYVKFCKIGALSATGTRPYAAGADGFVMGEGAALFVLKRLADAERAGDKIYAVVRGVGGASDGRGKGITAPNPKGQRLAIERAWRRAGIDPLTATLIEGHGTSTRVGDVVEVESMVDVFGCSRTRAGSIALGSVKSNIGHLKGAAGAAGVLKAALALHEKVLPPSLGFERPNPALDFAQSPFYVNTELRPWELPGQESGGGRVGQTGVGQIDVRRAGISAFGFGGTNFHAVLEEYVPGRIRDEGRAAVAVAGSEAPSARVAEAAAGPVLPAGRVPLRGALVLGAASEGVLAERLRAVAREADTGRAPAPTPPAEAELRAPWRLAIDYGDAAELAAKTQAALKAFGGDHPGMWRALRGRGIFRGRGEAPNVAFLYTGQGSQYVNMLADIRRVEPIVEETFAEADAVMEPLLGNPLSEYIFVDAEDSSAMARAAEDLRQTEITQPAVLAADIAMTRLLAAYGVVPNAVMGHSLGEYGALVAAGSLPFDQSLEAVSARGREMSHVSVEDKGLMAAVFAPLEEVEQIVASLDGYVVVANINSHRQAVIGGATPAVKAAIAAFEQAGHDVRPLPVSHAFHTRIVSPASEPLQRTLGGLDLKPPTIPIVTNVTGDFYPMGPGVVPEMVELLARQVAAPVQFVQGLETLYEAGTRMFVEVGPKRALHGFAENVLGHRDCEALFTNHPKGGGILSFNQALCGLYAAGLGVGRSASPVRLVAEPLLPPERQAVTAPVPASSAVAATAAAAGPKVPLGGDHYLELGHMFAEFLERGMELYRGFGAAGEARLGAMSSGEPDSANVSPAPRDRGGHGPPLPVAAEAPVAITGAAVGLPGGERVFDDANVGRLLRGEQMIDAVPMRFRKAMVDKRITRLVKTGGGGPRFETIDSPSEVIKLAGRAGRLDLAAEFGYPEERLAALDVDTRLAIGVGLDALRDAGIPLVMRYKTTSTGSQLPERWGLPDALRDETGVIFASAFPGMDAFAQECEGFYTDFARRQRLEELESLRARLAGLEAPVPGDAGATAAALAEIDRRVEEARGELEREGYVFDRRFLLRVLSMGHSQFAELIGARGPNTQINAACASTTQAVSLAEDWIRAGRCRRVVVIAADDVTTDHMLEWSASGFLASGAAATDELVEDAATPFDKRRHGMIVGMGAAGLVVESAAAARERGLAPVADVLAVVTANSAFHGTRLDVDHISQMMEQLVAQAESRWRVDRHQMAPECVFVSHETYTPARGGSAQAEVDALRHVFGPSADRIVVTNTKGYTGHAMAAGIEDVLAVKALETQQVPPVPNFRESDPELGRLNLSQGGVYPVRYALRLGAGFGSQISLSLLRRATPNGGHRAPEQLGYGYRIVDQAAWNCWLERISGHGGARLEVDHRTLRVVDEGPPERRPDLAPRSVPAPQPAVVAPLAPAVAAAPAPAATVAPGPAAVEAAVGAAAGAQVAGDPVEARILEIVSQQTGYPPDMLELDLDMEADLGIDTVKQAETFAAIRDAWDIPRDDTLQLRQYPTLKHAIDFVYEHRPDLEATATGAPPAAVAAAAATPAPVEAAAAAVAGDAAAGDPVEARILEIVSEQTGYPPDMLELDLDMEADLGIDTVKQAETFAAIRDAWDIPRDDALQLRDYPTLKSAIEFVYERRPDLVPAAAPAPSSLAPAPVAVEAIVSAAAGDAAACDPVEARILEIVSEQTGYPPDMLELDLDMEADLGIDTVKQAETFAAIRDAWDIPRDDQLQLRDYPTLKSAIGFVYERRPDLRPTAAAATAPPPAAAAPAPAVVPAAEAAGTLAVPRRVPVPVLRPPLELTTPTGVALDAGCRVVVMPDNGGVAKALIGRLRKRGIEVLMLLAGEVGREELDEQLRGWLEDGPINGVYWLPALDAAGDPAALDARAWEGAVELRVKHLYRTMRSLYEEIEAAGTFLVAATRLGGRHGFDPGGAADPLGGAVTGFVKTYKRERPDVLVKAVDFAPSRKTAALADLLIAETLSDPGAVEIGYYEGERWGVGLVEKEVEEVPLAPVPGGVYLVTGAAGSIVSAIVADLAASGDTFHLLDLAPEPDPANPDLERFHGDREGLQRDLFERLKAAGERATPARVSRELATLERSRAALDAIRAVEAAGGEARYHQLDLRDGEAVAAAVEAVREAHGRIDVLVHAAGLEISHFLPDKSPEEFDLVFDVKADGWYHLMRNLGAMEVGTAMAFSSIAGRFGNGGQTDYSAANDLLAKWTSSFRTQRPATRGVTIDWTAWAEIGMATRGSIPKMMALAGIDMLPPAAGIAAVRRELTAPGEGGEVVVAGGLGTLLEGFDAAGGLAVERLGSGPHGPMAQAVSGLGSDGALAVEVTLDPAEQAFLHDHALDGTPLLPGVMGIEAFAETAAVLAAGRRVAAVEDVDFLAPCKFYRGEPRTLAVRASYGRDGESVTADCRLLGSRVLPKAAAPQVTTHFAGRVRLASEPPPAADGRKPPPAGEAVVAPEDIYRIYFHGPAYQVLDGAWMADGTVVGRMADALPANHVPEDLPLHMAPRLVELCFQTAGVWEIATTGRLALPRHVDRVSVLRPPEEARGRFHALVEPSGDGFEARVVDEEGTVFVEVEGYRTIALPAPLAEEKVAPLRAVMT